MGIQKVFIKHHSRDSCFLRRLNTEIQGKMAAEETFPWVCPCGRLNKKSAEVCVVCWGHWTKGKKHDVTPKQKTYGDNSQWSESWENWDQSQEWEHWGEAESVRQSSQSPRGRQQWQDTQSPRQRNVKGKGKGKWKGKGKTKSEASGSPFGQAKGGLAPLPPWPAWNVPEPSQSPFQTAQSAKNSTMQEMAVHLRQAYKEKDNIPQEVQAFLEKADKEYSKNNIKSLHAATKNLDHAQKALREAVEAKKDHRLQWTKHVSEGIKVWETQLESYRVHQATLSEHASKARLEIEASRKILKEVSDSAVKEGNLSIPQPILEEAEDSNADHVDQEEQKLRDKLQGVLNACAGSLGLQVGPDAQVQEVSDDDKETIPQHKRPRSVEPAKPGGSTAKQ